MAAGLYRLNTTLVFGWFKQVTLLKLGLGVATLPTTTELP